MAQMVFSFDRYLKDMGSSLLVRIHVSRMLDLTDKQHLTLLLYYFILRKRITYLGSSPSII